MWRSNPLTSPTSSAHSFRRQWSQTSFCVERSVRPAGASVSPLGCAAGPSALVSCWSAAGSVVVLFPELEFFGQEVVAMGGGESQPLLERVFSGVVVVDLDGVVAVGSEGSEREVAPEPEQAD